MKVTIDPASTSAKKISDLTVGQCFRDASTDALFVRVKSGLKVYGTDALAVSLSGDDWYYIDIEVDEVYTLEEVLLKEVE